MEEILETFKSATDILDALDLDYVVFGGIAVWAYGRRRPTKDIDLLIRKKDARSVLTALDEAGFLTEETDDRWLFKATLNQFDIDLIFETLGGIELNSEIIERRRLVEIEGYAFQIIDPENLVILKVLPTKERRPADWYDALSVIENVDDFDWDYLVSQAKQHVLKILSFIFFAQAMYEQNDGRSLVPARVINRLYRIYLDGQSISKTA